MANETFQLIMTSKSTRGGVVGFQNRKKKKSEPDKKKLKIFKIVRILSLRLLHSV